MKSEPKRINNWFEESLKKRLIQLRKQTKLKFGKIEWFNN